MIFITQPKDKCPKRTQMSGIAFMSDSMFTISAISSNCAVAQLFEDSTRKVGMSPATISSSSFRSI